VIRRAEGRDAAALAAFLRAASTHPERVTAQGVTRDLIADARVVLLVADEGGVVQGFVSGHPSYDSGASRWGFTMNDLFVAPEARRRGLGRALVAALAEQAVGDGGEYLRWDTAEADALGFHRAMGAEERRTHSFHIGGATFRDWAGEP